MNDLAVSMLEFALLDATAVSIILFLVLFFRLNIYLNNKNGKKYLRLCSITDATNNSPSGRATLYMRLYRIDGCPWRPFFFVREEREFYLKFSERWFIRNIER